MHWAATSGHHKVIDRLLVEMKLRDERAQDGLTNLHLAVESGHQETIETLLKHNCDTFAIDAVSQLILNVSINKLIYTFSIISN